MEYTFRQVVAMQKWPLGKKIEDAIAAIEKDNHISTLRKTHPRLWEHYMESGLGDELIKLQQYKSNGAMNLLSFKQINAERAMRERPCAFDEIPDMLQDDAFTRSGYDADADD